VIVSLLLGTGITLLASILPARRATRVPPIAAVREGSTLPPTRMAAHSHNAGVVVTVASLAAISLGIFAGGVSALALGLLIGGGLLGLFFGIAMLAPRLVKPLARVVGLPARRAGGVAGELAGANAVRNPGRTASTAAALMIGLTLVTVVAVLGAGVNAGTKSAIEEQVHADYVVDGKQGLPFSATEGDKLAATTGVKSASHVRSDTAIVQGEQQEITGIDPATIAAFYTFDWTTGSDRTLGQLDADGALVSEQYANDKHLEIGSEVSVKTPSGEKRTLVVQGVYDPPEQNPLLGDVSMTKQAFDKAFNNPKNSFTFLAADADTGTALEAAAKDSGDAALHTGAEYPKDATKDMATVMAMLYVLLGFSVIVSLFGMVNTMVLSVFERTREIGMLRTIGMTRRQARRMIRHESVITALIGTALGLGLGLFLAGLVIEAVSMDGLAFVIPVQALAAFTAVAVIAGIGAAILPARRASRLNVLDALHYE
jgi:putative ABC transport system permease protein